MLYYAYELTHASISPFRQTARMTNDFLKSPFNPMLNSIPARVGSAACEMFINATKRYGKPEFGLKTVDIDQKTYDIKEEIVWSEPFCNLLHFKRLGYRGAKNQKILIVAPMSGHFATLLRGTVKALLPDFDIYITDWVDAREVPMFDGHFDLDDYSDYIIKMLQFLGKSGERASVLAVCQPGVPVTVAATLMAMDNDPARPASITLMGSPIDTRKSPTQPNDLANGKPLSWFEQNVIVTVPWPHPGFGRQVYPGFLQLSGFMSMNMDRHVDAHYKNFQHLVIGDGESSEAHQNFYDEYLAVMDLTKEFYLQTIDRVFQRHLLPNGAYLYRDKPINPAAIKDIGIMSIEGEKDDITGLGQTEAIHKLVTELPEKYRCHLTQEGVGHYGIFNGSRWRSEIKPRVTKFVETHRAKIEAN